MSPRSAAWALVARASPNRSGAQTATTGTITTGHSRALPRPDEMKRLSKLLVDLGSAKASANSGSLDLLRSQGYIRQSTSGTYNILPLGLRVQHNIENIVRKHLDGIGACELSLATLQSIDLWKKSGRYKTDGAELFVLPDSNYLLAPTAEEQVTSLVKSAVSSYKQLPLLVYQISRKYRDELRPRGGLCGQKSSQ